MSGQLQNYLDAENPKLVSALKLPLLPLSIGHLELLEQSGNPFLDPDCPAHIFILPRLMEAALICSQTVEDARAMDHDILLGLKIKIWGWRIRKCDTVKEAQIFKEYIKQGMREPITRPGNGRIPGAPWYLQLRQFLEMRKGKSESEAVNYPYTKAVWEFCAYYEAEGQAEIRNSQELASAQSIAANEAEVNKFMEENPGKVISPEEWLSGTWRNGKAVNGA